MHHEQIRLDATRNSENDLRRGNSPEKKIGDVISQYKTDEVRTKTYTVMRRDMNFKPVPGKPFNLRGRSDVGGTLEFVLHVYTTIIGYVNRDGAVREGAFFELTLNLCEKGVRFLIFLHVSTARTTGVEGCRYENYIFDVPRTDMIQLCCIHSKSCGKNYTEQELRERGNGVFLKFQDGGVFWKKLDKYRVKDPGPFFESRGYNK